MIESFSYIGFTSPRAEEWTSFGPGVIGMELAGRGPDGAVRLRIDDAAYRVAIHPGQTDDIAYVGWGVCGPRALNAVTETLARAGISVTEGKPELAAERQVAELVSFDDPFGIRQEVSWGQITLPSSFRPGRAHSGFVTGQGGLGHAVIIVPGHDQAEAFYCGLLGFKMTDQIQQPGQPRLRFYNCNERHHSLAMIEVPGITGFHHLMLETRSIDDVGTALDLIRGGAGGELTMTLGRHCNDRMTSFYVRTPAAFEIEYGYGGIVLDDSVHLPRLYEKFSIWGHKPVGGAMAPPGIIRVLGQDAPAPGSLA